MGFSAVLDTCVLWPSLQRDFLLSLAAERLYQPLWSTAILTELAHHEAIKLRTREGLDETEAQAKAEHLIAQMSSAFDGAMVVGWEPLEGTYGLADVDDEHVLAAAVVGGAGAIVTDNLRHLDVPQVPAHIQVLSSREFITDTVDLNPPAAAEALRQIARRHQSPPHTPEELLDLLEQRYGLSEVVEIIRAEL